MKKLIMLVALIAPIPSQAFEVNVFGGFFAFDDSQTQYDYRGLSPLGEYGIELRHRIDNRFSVAVGYKHVSGTNYREIGKGFNGPFLNLKLKIY